MAPFQYEPFASRYVGTIADLLGRPGEIEAHRAETIGDIAARAAMSRGAAWADAIGRTGSIVASIPGQIQQQQDLAQQRETRTLQNQTAARELARGDLADATRARVSQLMSDPSLLNDDGTFNVKGILDRANAAPTPGAPGVMTGPQRPIDAASVYALVDPINQSILQSREQKATLAKQTQQTIGLMAARVLEAGKASGDYLGYAHLGAAALAKSGLVTDADAAKFLVPLIERSAAGPAAVEAALHGIVAASGLPPIKLGKDEKLLSGADFTELASNPAPKPGYTINGQRFDGDTHQPVGPVVPPQTAPKSLETKSVLLDGKPAEVVFNPGTGRFQDATGADVTARVKPIPPASVQVNQSRENPPGDWTKTGDDFLTTIPVQWRATVKKIASYEEDPAKVASMRGGMRETVMQWVNQVNPGYKADEFANRAPTRKAYTTGTQGQQITAINTAIGHLDQLASVADQLNNGSFVPGNAAWNTVRSIFGADTVTNFETLKDALAGEVASVLSKGAATVSGIAAEKDKIKAASSPQQLAGYVRTLIPIMGSKLAALDYAYHQAMGADDTFSALSADSKQILTKYGFDPAHSTIDQTGSPNNGPKATLKFNPATGKLEPIK